MVGSVTSPKKGTRSIDDLAGLLHINYIFPLHFRIHLSQFFTFLRTSSFYDVTNIMTSRHPHK